MSKNNKNSNMNFINSKIIEDAAKKLQQIEKGQKQADKYFKEREVNEQKLKTIEINLRRKINAEKKSSTGVEEKTFEKIENLLQMLGNLDTNALEKINYSRNEKNSQYIQTEKEETETLKEKFFILEKENEKLIVKKNELKKDLAVAKTEIESLKTFNEKLNKENKLMQNNLEEMINSREDSDLKFKEICNENKELKEKLKKYEQNLKEFEVLKKNMEDQLKIEKETVEEEEKTRLKVIEHYRGSLEMLGYLKILDKVTYYLQPKEINNLRLTNKSINLEVGTNPNCSRDYYRKCIFNYQKKIFDQKKFDFRKEYHTSEGELERIMSEYDNNYIIFNRLVT